jgi:hypothetical protein
MDDQIKDDQTKEATSQRIVSILISVIAVAIAFVHLLVPALKIDWITLALLGVAIVPWLSPLLKSIEGPGGWKVEFREFRRQVAEGLSENRERVTALTDRVDKLALAFTGTVSTEQQHRITDDLERFRTYLKNRGVDVPPQLPVVQGVPGLSRRKERFVDYDSEAAVIHVDSEFADDTDLLLYTYAEHLLVYPLRDLQGQTEKESWTGGEQAILRAIAHYLVCSFKGDPISMRKTAARTPAWREINLENDRRFGQINRFTPYTAMADERDVWGAVFWTLRGQITAEVTDPLVVTTWMQAEALPNPKEFRQSFGQLLVSLATEQHDSETADQIENVLKTRGFKTANKSRTVRRGELEQ